MTDPTDAWNLDTRTIGRCVWVYDRLDSTNTRALALADNPAHHGQALLAREQSAGRGQYGRNWHAPPGSSVLLSVLVFPPAPLRRPALLTAWAAVSLCDAISNLTHLDAAIKWPNDVLIDSKKVCGILIEQRTTGQIDHPLAAVVGIGLNVTQPTSLFEQAGLPHAASLASMSGLTIAYKAAAIEVLRQLDTRYHKLLDDGLESLESDWSRRLGLAGEFVRIEGLTANHCGQLLEVTLAGLVIDIDGTRVRLAPEAIKHITRAPGEQD